jgi:hypothetical protein
MRGDSPRRPAGARTAGARTAGARTAGARTAGARPASRARLNSRRGLLSPCLVVVSKRQQATWWWPCRSSLRPVQCGPFSFRGGGGLQGRPADTGRPAGARSCRPPTRDPLPTPAGHAAVRRGAQKPAGAPRGLQERPEAARRAQTPAGARRGRQRPPEGSRWLQRPADVHPAARVGGRGQPAAGAARLHQRGRAVKNFLEFVASMLQ